MFALHCRSVFGWTTCGAGRRGHHPRRLGSVTLAVQDRDSSLHGPRESGPQPRAVVSASSETAAALEMHEMKMEKTMMRMTLVAAIRIPAKGRTSLNSNGLHIMMFGLKTRLAVGDTIGVTLKLDDGTTVPVEATVRK